jgi:hypothetical protein
MWFTVLFIACKSGYKKKQDDRLKCAKNQYQICPVCLMLFVELGVLMGGVYTWVD